MSTESMYARTNAFIEELQERVRAEKARADTAEEKLREMQEVVRKAEDLSRQYHNQAAEGWEKFRAAEAMLKAGSAAWERETNLRDAAETLALSRAARIVDLEALVRQAEDRCCTLENESIGREGWICERHPSMEFPHDDCAGPGVAAINRVPMMQKDVAAFIGAVLQSARGDEKGEQFTIRAYLDQRDVFNDDIQGSSRLIEEACKVALRALLPKEQKTP